MKQNRKQKEKNQNKKKKEESQPLGPARSTSPAATEPTRGPFLPLSFLFFFI
jgi:hypothetical protein